MPRYDYQCKQCGNKFEHFQSMSSDNLLTCNECKTNSLEKIISGGVGIMFKEDYSAHHENLKRMGR